jgi:hypothetical protein
VRVKILTRAGVTSDSDDGSVGGVGLEVGTISGLAEGSYWRYVGQEFKSAGYTYLPTMRRGSRTFLPTLAMAKEISATLNLISNQKPWS